jgi:hypothetical protein
MLRFTDILGNTFTKNISLLPDKAIKSVIHLGSNVVESNG